MNWLDQLGSGVASNVNVFGLLAVTQAFVPLLGSDPARTGPPGRIVNITSVGGRLASPFLGAYTATKHAVEAMTDTLRRELVIYGIDAIAIGRAVIAGAQPGLDISGSGIQCACGGVVGGHFQKCDCGLAP